jgi:hypothetical protein
LRFGSAPEMIVPASQGPAFTQREPSHAESPPIRS